MEKSLVGFIKGITRRFWKLQDEIQAKFRIETPDLLLRNKLLKDPTRLLSVVSFDFWVFLVSGFVIMLQNLIML